MNDDELLTLMRLYAEDAVAIAKRCHDITLDYSEQSIVAVDEILDRMTSGGTIDASTLKPEDEEELWNYCKAYGGYIGEVISRYIGAVWKAKPATDGSSNIELFVANQITASPPQKVWKRLMESEFDRMIGYYRGLQHVLGLPLFVPAEVKSDSPQESNHLTSATPTGDEQDLTAETKEVLARLEAWQPLRETIRERATNWMRSPAFRTVYYDDAHVPLALKHALEQEVSKKESRELWGKIQFLGLQSPQLWNQYQQLATHGQVWFAVPMMTNPAFNTEIHAMLPCGVIVATEQTSMEILLAGVFAMVAYELYSGGGDKAKFPGTTRMMSDDSYRIFYREAFPLEETQGSPFTLMSVLLRSSWMPPEEVPFIPLLVMPGPQGAVIQIPWHIATATPPPPGSMNPGRFADVAQVDRMADKMVAEHNSKKWGCWNIISLIIWVIFIGGLIGGVAMILFGEPGKAKKPSEIREDAQPKTIKK